MWVSFIMLLNPLLSELTGIWDVPLGKCLCAQKQKVELPSCSLTNSDLRKLLYGRLM